MIETCTIEVDSILLLLNGKPSHPLATVVPVAVVMTPEYLFTVTPVYEKVKKEKTAHKKKNKVRRRTSKNSKSHRIYRKEREKQNAGCRHKNTDAVLLPRTCKFVLCVIVPLDIFRPPFNVSNEAVAFSELVKVPANINLTSKSESS